MALKLPKLNINRTWLMLLAALGLATLASFMTMNYLKTREKNMAAEMAARAQQGGPTASVVVPVRDMPAGSLLEDNSVAARDVATDLVYPGAITADEFEKYKGQALIRPVLQGRPLLKADLRETFSDFSGSLPDGIRAMTIDIDELNSVAHMVQPGNMVDLMLVMRRDDGGQTVVPFMDRMKVLATGQRLVPDENPTDQPAPGGKRTFSYSTLTMEVTPTQAARLTLAQDLGKMRFVLRNEKDKGSVDYSVNAQNIFDEMSARAQRSKRTSTAGVVEFIIGGQRSGPSAKSVDVNVPGATLAANTVGGSVPPLVPSLAPKGAAKAPAANTPAASNAAPAAQKGVDANGLTPEMKSELKTLIEK
jgi:pilus assembly protein CpaB